MADEKISESSRTADPFGASLLPIARAGENFSITLLEVAEPRVNFKWFGAVGNGSTNDSINGQAAFDHISAVGGGIITVPPGTYIGHWTIHANTTLELTPGATLRLENAAPVIQVLLGDGDNIRIRGQGIIDGNGANNVANNFGFYIPGGVAGFTNCRVQDITVLNCINAGLRIEDVDDVKVEGVIVERTQIVDLFNQGIYIYGNKTTTLNVTIRDCIVKYAFGDGIFLKNTQHSHVYGNYIQDAGHQGLGWSGIAVSGGDRFTEIFGNIVLDCLGSGISIGANEADCFGNTIINVDQVGIDAVTAGLNDVSIIDNVVMDTGLYCCRIGQSAVRAAVEGNKFYHANQSENNRAVLFISKDGTEILVADNQLWADDSLADKEQAIEVERTANENDVTIIGNKIFEVAGIGIRALDLSDDAVIANNYVRANSATAEGIRIEALDKAAVNRPIVKDNILEGTMLRGIRLQGAAIADALVQDNVIGASITNPITDGGTNTIIRRNTGFITENSGIATILNATTSIAVNHGLDVTPTLDDISIVLGENPLNDPGNIWVDTIGAAQFTINCRNDPGANDLDVAWQAIVL